MHNQVTMANRIIQKPLMKYVSTGLGVSEVLQPLRLGTQKQLSIDTTCPTTFASLVLPSTLHRGSFTKAYQPKVAARTFPPGRQMVQGRRHCGLEMGACSPTAARFISSTQFTHARRNLEELASKAHRTREKRARIRRVKPDHDELRWCAAFRRLLQN